MTTSHSDVGLVTTPAGAARRLPGQFRLDEGRDGFRGHGGCFQGRHGRRRLWDGQAPDYVKHHTEDSDLTILGHWACDGNAEYYRLGFSRGYPRPCEQGSSQEGGGEGLLQGVVHPKGGGPLGRRVPHRAPGPCPLQASQGQSRLEHRQRQYHRRLDRAAIPRRGEGATPLGGPFPHILKLYGSGRTLTPPGDEVGKPDPRSRPIVRDLSSEGRQRIEVSYDPAIGYLPRFVRTLLLFLAEGSGVRRQDVLWPRRGLARRRWFRADRVVEHQL